MSLFTDFEKVKTVLIPKAEKQAESVEEKNSTFEDNTTEVKKPEKEEPKTEEPEMKEGETE